MVYLSKRIPKESVVSNSRVRELELLLESVEAKYNQSQDQLTHQVNLSSNLQEKYRDDTNILSAVIYYFVDNCGVDRQNLNDAINASNYEAYKVRDVLAYHEAVPEDMLVRQYEVSVTVPVTVCISVEAVDENTAQQMALDDVESNGLEWYSMEYSLHYDAEFSVEEN
jgi:hypothetical protein